VNTLAKTKKATKECYFVQIEMRVPTVRSSLRSFLTKAALPALN
jgi:hypothetical protein